MSTSEAGNTESDRQPIEGYIEYTFRGQLVDISQMSQEERDAALKSDFRLAAGSAYKPSGSHLEASRLVITKYQED